MSVAVWIGVGAIGGLAALLRFAVDGFVGARMPGEYPFGTFAVNVSGSFVLGIIAGAALRGDALLLAGTTALGSYTTFSTWMLESHRLGEDGALRPAAANLVASVAVGLIATEIGRLIGGLL